jgi:hypothetical protein
MQAFQWSQLPRINEVDRGLDASDRECLREVAQVLRAHGKEWRFGVNLLHSHFDLGEDEVLLETNDVRDNSLWIRPIPKAEVANEDIVETAWCLADGQPRMGCVCKKLGDDHAHHHNR